MLGKKQSDEMKAHLSKLFKGQPGRIWTDEQRIKSSNSHKGKIFTAEHRENISKRRNGMVFSDEHRANIGKAQLGRKQSIDSQKKRSESLKKYHAERRRKKLLEENNETKINPLTCKHEKLPMPEFDEEASKDLTSLEL